MSTAFIKPAMIRWARKRAGLTVSDLTERFPKYEQWEAGKARPTMRQAEQLAKATFTPLGYLFLPSPPDESLPISDFRTVSDRKPRRPSPDLLETIQTMLRRQRWMREFLVEQGASEIAFVGSTSTDEDELVTAKRIRRDLGLPASWAVKCDTWQSAVAAFREALEDAGIFVVINGIVGNNTHRKLDPEEFRGFVLVDEFCPFIFVNGADSKSAQMFTLAHEAAHIWIGESGVCDLPDLQPGLDVIERFCNQVAAEFLVPSDALRHEWGNRQTQPVNAIHTLSRRFKASPIVVARRALDLRLISRVDFFSFYHRSIAAEQRAADDQSGGDFYRNQNNRVGKRFAMTVVRAAREGQILYREAYGLLDLYGDTFDKYADSIAVE